MATEFTQAVGQLQQWGTSIAVLEAEGPAFSAGADLSDLQSAATALDEMLEMLLSVPLYWIAIVRGAVRGGALSLIAACPRVLATPAASFGLPELSRGFFPADVVRGQAELLGSRRAFELAFTAEAIDAERALSIGLVSDVQADDAIKEVIDAEIRHLTSMDKDALRHGIELWQFHARRLLAGYSAPGHPASHVRTHAGRSPV